MRLQKNSLDFLNLPWWVKVVAVAFLLVLSQAARGADLALKFDGVNDFVTFGQTSALGATNFTLELWFMRQGAGVTTNTGSGGVTAVPLLTKGRAEADGDTRDMNYFFGIGTNNVLTADLETFVGGTNKPVVGVTPIVNDVWYHAAVTYDGTNWAMYLNGSLETNLFVGNGILPRYDSAQRAGLATTMATNGVAAGFFAGTLDEPRIWNYARSQQEIRDNLRVAITTASGLLGRWGLDAGSGTIATNSANVALSGILSNGPVYVSGYPFALAGTGGLFFDGTNDFVTCGPTNALGLTTFTIETWFKRTGTGTFTSSGTGGVVAYPLVTKGRGEAENSNVDMNYFMGIATNNNRLCADFEQFGGGTNWPVYGTTSITTDTWYHAAATFDGTNLSVYLNGVLEGTTNVAPGVVPRSDSIQHMGLGTAMTSVGAPQGAFLGVLDEVRIWNYPRSAAQIQDNMSYPIPSDTGLVARWGLDQEFGNIATNSGTSLVHGILSNGAVWVAGKALAPVGSGGLFFDGDNDYVTFGPTNALGLSTFTIETWFQRTGTGKSANTGAGGLIAIPLVAKGRNETDASNVDMNYFLGITTNDNRLCADFERTPDGTNHPIVGVTAITNGGWYHAAATYDGSSWSLYLNGVLETNAFVGQTPRSDSIQHASLGAALNSSGTPNGAFQGLLDEVRIWNYARSGSQVQNNMGYAIPSETGLVGRWGLDETTGLIAANSGSSGVNGSLSNGPAWSIGYPLTTNTPVLSVGVTNVTPNCGPTTGGTTVTITGSNFVNGATVTIGGNAAGSVVVVNGSEITAVTPAGTAGDKIVSVTNTNGEFGALTNGFSYLGPPAPSNNGPICAGQTLNLFANTNATSYSWTGPNAFSSTNENPSIAGATTAASGTYSLTFTLNGCESATGTTVATVNALPIVTASGATNICSGGSATLTAGGAVTYTWSPAAGLDTTNGTTVVASPASTTMYTVTGTDANGCQNTADVTVNVNPVPTCTVTPSNATVCASATQIFTANPSGGTSPYTFSWSGPNSNSALTASITVSNAQAADAGTYQVTITDSNGCVTSCSATLAVDTNAAPSAPAITTPTTGFCITAGNFGAFTVAGTADTNGTVRIFAGATLLAEMLADGSGNWSTNLDFTAEADGSVSLTAVATNNCFSSSSPAVVGTKDLLAPSFAGLASITAAVEAATLTWSAAVDTSSVTYAVFQATTSGGQNFGLPVLTTNSLSALIAPLYPGSNSPLTYFFVVRATDACGNGETNTVELPVQPLLDPNGDQDSDGMPNSFEQAYGLNPFSAADAGLDSDGDGQTNLQEALAGNDPTNSVSVLRITSIERAGDDVIVSWLTGTGRTNALQWTAGSGNGSYETNNFADLFTVTNAIGGITNYPDAGAATNIPSRYYRIRLIP